MRGAGLVIVGLLLAGCAGGPVRSDGASSSSATTSRSTTPTPMRAPAKAPVTSTMNTRPAWGGCGEKAAVPDSGMLAFDFNPTDDVDSEQAEAPGDIFTVSGDGAGLRSLTFSLDSTSPTWSPDGSQLAFLRTDWRHDYSSELWVMNADGSH